MTDGTKMLELITSRHIDRKYSDKPVEKEKLDRILEAGRMLRKLIGIPGPKRVELIITLGYSLREQRNKKL